MKGARSDAATTRAAPFSSAGVVVAVVAVAATVHLQRFGYPSWAVEMEAARIAAVVVGAAAAGIAAPFETVMESSE